MEPQKSARGARTMTEKEIFALCDRVREAVFALQRFLRHGHMEKVYENGLVHRLRNEGLPAEQQHALKVIADLFIKGIYDTSFSGVGRFCEAAKSFAKSPTHRVGLHLADEHVAQLLGYLRACRIEHGLLINFGSPKLQIRKYALSEAP